MSLHITAQARYAFLGTLIAERLRPPARIVELGAAPGDQIVKIAEQGYDTTAVDIGVASDGWADGTEGRMKDLLEQGGVDYVEWDLEQTPYPLEDAAFDGVIFTEVFEHLRDYPARSLGEVARVLRPGGYLFFTTPNAAYLMNRLRLLRGGTSHTSRSTTGSAGCRTPGTHASTSSRRWSGAWPWRASRSSCRRVGTSTSRTPRLCGASSSRASTSCRSPGPRSDR